MEDIGWALIRTKNLRHVRNMRKLLAIYKVSTILSYKQWHRRLSPKHKYPEISKELMKMGGDFKDKRWIFIPLNTLGNIHKKYLQELLEYGVIVSNSDCRQIIHADSRWKALSVIFKEHSL